jgi:hypothetical protein
MVFSRNGKPGFSWVSSWDVILSRLGEVRGKVEGILYEEGSGLVIGCVLSFSASS